MILRYDNRDFGPNERHGATGQGDQDWAKTLENLMSLARGAADAFDFDRALGYLNSMEDIWDSKGLPEFSLDMRFEMHRAKGKAYASLGKLDDAIEEYQKILCFCRDSAHLTVKAETFGQIGQLLGKQGDHDRALGYIQRAIGAHRRLRDKAGMCRALRNLGVSYIELGEFEEAELTYHNAIALAEELGERLLYADLVNNLGAIRNMRGDWRQALEHYRESLDIYTAENEIRKSAYTKNNVAITLTEQGLTDDALICFEEAHEIATQIKDASLLLIVDINLADLYLKKGRADLAQAHCIKAERYLLENQLNNGHMVEVHKIAGKIASENNQHEPALQRFDQAYRLASEIGTQYLEAEVLLERGTLLRKMGRHFDALNDLEASYNTYNSLKADGKREKTEEVIHSIESLYLDVFDSMGRDVDQKDPYTKGHSDRVAALALLLARELGLKSSVRKTLVAGGLLHDIGKIRIDDAILNKAGRLTDDEFTQIKKHAEYGIALLEGKEFPWNLKPLILHHHEHYDGSGYPMGLKGDNIPLGARIICVADVFDALTSDRVYRAAFAPAKALEIMAKESGTTFDPVLFKSFVTLIESGKADLVTNSRTRQDEMYSIWSECRLEQDQPEDDSVSPASPETAPVTVS